MTERPTLAVGLMSGTSLDGVDAALVRFEGPSHCSLLHFVTRPYANEETIRAQARMRGTQAGCRYAETFQVIRWISG